MKAKEFNLESQFHYGSIKTMLQGEFTFCYLL